MWRLSGDFYDYGTVSVQPGDAITTIFDLYSPTGEWIDNWILEPGTAGAAAGETPSSGGITNTFAFTGTLTQVCTPLINCVLKIGLMSERLCS